MFGDKEIRDQSFLFIIAGYEARGNHGKLLGTRSSPILRVDDGEHARIRDILGIAQSR